jgi:hypothetical protein
MSTDLEQVSNKLEQLRIFNIVDNIDLLISTLRYTSYISSVKRSQILGFIEPTENLIKIYSQSPNNYIERSVVRETIHLLEKIKTKFVSLTVPIQNENLTKEYLFSRLVYSNKLVEPVVFIFNELLGGSNYKYSINSSLFTVSLFGKMEENLFYKEFFELFKKQFDCCDEELLKSIFNYHGNVLISVTLE